MTSEAESPDPVADPGNQSAPAPTGERSGRPLIGSQRPGAKPAPLAARYRYVVTAPEERNQAVDEPAATVPGPPRAAAALPTPAAPPAGQETAGGSRRAGGERRRRSDRSAATMPVAHTPPARVAVPNIRAALDDDLEADFAAAVGDLAIDDLLEAQGAIKAEAPLEPGTRVRGVVLRIGADTAFIDLGGRRQGAMKLAGFLERDDEIPEPGAVVEVSVGVRNEQDGLYEVAPANRAIAVEDWSQLEAGMVVAARVTAANKGGLECDVAGLRGFMPASLVSTWRVENLEEMVGQTLESLVTEIVPAARRLVLSRRAVIEKQASEARTRLLETLEPGAELDGIVRSVRDFGAFIDIGNGVEGLVHTSELSWDRVANPADVLQPGQRVRVVVKKIDRQTGKIGLSARDLVESPWKRAADKYHAGATVRGVVSRIAQFGAFVKLEPGIEGLVHISELATRRIRAVSDVVKEGETVECRVLSLDPEGQKLSLSIKALAPPPASAAKPAAEETEPEVEPEAPASRKQRTTPLKGGVGGSSAGGRFGLKW